MPESISSSRRLSLLVVFLLTAAFLLSLRHSNAAPQNSVPQADAAQIETGRRLFAGACSNSYCHGTAGTGGGGPKLQQRNFTAVRLTRIISEGVKGTGMPAFKSTYKADEIAALVAYVLSLSPDNAAAVVDPHGATPNAAAETVASTAPKAALTAADKEFLAGSDAQTGRALFFDTTVLNSCRVCHTFNGRGGKVGPDLSGIASQPAAAIYQSIVNPGASVTEKYQTISVTTRTGLRVTGVRRDENAEMIRVYDTSVSPPVSRAMLKADIVQSETLPGSAMPAGYEQKYTRQQLLAVVAWLKTGD